MPRAPHLRPGMRDGGGSRRGRRVATALMVAGLLAVGLSALEPPEPARAVGLDPIGGLGDVLGAGLGAVSGGLGNVAVDGFAAVLHALFAWPARLVNQVFLRWLVSVPDYAVAPATVRGAANSNLAELAGTVSAMAFAALAAAGTVGGLRYWAAGLTGSGGFDAVESIGRMTGAALLIVLWPWIFRHCVDLANAAGTGLLASPSVLDDTSRVLAAAFVAGVSLNFFAIVIAFGAGLLFLALAMCKIVVSASTALLYVGMPIALLLWVIPELGWVARTAVRAFAVVLLIPFAWALSFATFAAVGVDALTGQGSGSFADGLIKPLVALALLAQCVTLPKTLARMAMLGAGGGFVSRMGSYVIARRVDGGVTRVVAATTSAASKHQSAGHAAPAAAGTNGPRSTMSSPTSGRRAESAGAAPVSRSTTSPSAGAPQTHVDVREPADR